LAYIICQYYFQEIREIRETYGFPGRPFPFSKATEGSDIQIQEIQETYGFLEREGASGETVGFPDFLDFIIYLKPYMV
jgi:hypothetical protein